MNKRMDDQELMEKIKNGDEVAFSELMTMYKDRVVNFLYQFTGDYQVAVDLSQETFLRVFFKAKKYRPIAPVSSWIYAIAANLARTERKKINRKAAIPLDEIANSYSAGSYSLDHNDPGLMRNVKQALGRLHPRYRLPVILKDVEGFSQEEIASMLKLPVGTVKARISRGREYLRRWLVEGREIKNRGEEDESYSLKLPDD
ncbi:MAG TPA: RNA polymerase sigma factor [Candidatus Saccharicenans sp.]|nr:RNA polymerase sigma factor [Candidatus Saccharicenans sp.]